MKSLTIRELARWFLSANGYVILTHRRPDGDTVGSAAALCRGLRSLGKRASILDNPQLTDRYRPFVEGLTCPTLRPHDVLVTTDIASPALFPLSAPESCAAQIAVVVDHHPSNTGFANAGLVRPEAAACGEIIYDLLLEMGVKLDRDMAEALYVALSTDTGCFRYTNTTARTLQVAAACLELGARSGQINRTFFSIRRFSRLRLDAYLTEHVAFYENGTIALCRIPRALEQELALTEDDLEDVSGFARDIEGVTVGLTLRTLPSGQTKLSVRCGPPCDASRLCAHLGGGGHAAAAGATLSCGQDEAAERILSALRQEGLLT